MIWFEVSFISYAYKAGAGWPMHQYRVRAILKYLTPNVSNNITVSTTQNSEHDKSAMDKSLWKFCDI